MITGRGFPGGIDFSLAHFRLAPTIPADSPRPLGLGTLRSGMIGGTSARPKAKGQRQQYARPRPCNDPCAGEAPAQCLRQKTTKQRLELEVGYCAWSRDAVDTSPGGGPCSKAHQIAKSSVRSSAVRPGFRHAPRSAIPRHKTCSSPALLFTPQSKSRRRVIAFRLPCRPGAKADGPCIPAWPAAPSMRTHPGNRPSVWRPVGSIRPSAPRAETE